MDQDDIREAMKQVDDPELGINVVDLGLLYGVSMDEGGAVTLDMTLTSMGCPLTDQIIADVRKYVEPLDGVTAVDVNWVWDPPWGPDKMTDDGKLMMEKVTIQRAGGHELAPLTFRAPAVEAFLDRQSFRSVGDGEV
ncbi:MAG: metal-sulfur cluster assembly factor, partial [Miltoncostaeaceae bacterium]